MQFGTLSVADHHPGLGRSAPQFYAELIDQAILAEELGYESFWVAEHHFHEYGIVPAPAVLLSAIAQRTETLRLGTAVVVCPFHDPRVVAEQYALLDVLSGGRLNFGAGSGYLPHEFAGFGVDPADKRERFDESFDIVRRLWRGERVTAHGAHHQLDDVAINVSPLQQPTPPTWTAVIRADAAPFVARRGESVMGIPYALERIGAVHEMLTAYHDAHREAGHDPATADVTLAWHTYVAATVDEAIADTRDAMHQYTSTRLYATSQDKTFEELYENGLLLIGDAAYVRERIAELGDAGMTRMLTLTNFGALPHERVTASMRRFASDVMPAFRS
jgi:alkanesulfonate monooxygenase SsuD/methylene tetrahydromethanopterin reductase-like flavin-dependent oxidoreductase (luciferase family)